MFADRVNGLMLELIGKLMAEEIGGGRVQCCSGVLELLKHLVKVHQRKPRGLSLIGQCYDELSILPVEIEPVHISSPHGRPIARRFVSQGPHGERPHLLD